MGNISCWSNPVDGNDGPEAIKARKQGNDKVVSIL